MLPGARAGSAERHFRGRCGSALRLFSPDWPKLIHRFASAIDTPPPGPPCRTHLMPDFKPGGGEPGRGDNSFGGYPEKSLAQWPERQGLS